MAVIDEIQMIGDNERGHAWTRCVFMCICADVHVCLCICVFICTPLLASHPEPLIATDQSGSTQTQFLTMINLTVCI